MDYAIPEARYPNIEVAGEAYREVEIVAAIGRSPGLDEEIEVELPAALIPEPDNPYDKDAISVRINGQSVGYIERDSTKDYRQEINRITASGHVAVTMARVWAVRREHYSEGTRFYARVTIALPYGGIKLPVNQPPGTSYSLLPWGPTAQVTDEEAYFETLKRYLPKSGDGLMLVALVRGEKQMKTVAPKEIVNVLVDGQQIGELTPTTSRHFLPTIDHMTSRGADLIAWAKFKGSAISIEVTVHAEHANELDNDWLVGPLQTVPNLIPEAAAYALPPAYVPSKTPPKPEPRSSSTPSPAKAGCLVVAIAGAGVVGTGVAFVSALQAFA